MFKRNTSLPEFTGLKQMIVANLGKDSGPYSDWTFCYGGYVYNGTAEIEASDLEEGLKELGLESIITHDDIELFKRWGMQTPGIYSGRLEDTKYSLMILNNSHNNLALLGKGRTQEMSFYIIAENEQASKKIYSIVYREFKEKAISGKEAGFLGRNDLLEKYLLNKHVLNFYI